ncbi:terminase [Streptomyces xanthophaeus]
MSSLLDVPSVAAPRPPLTGSQHPRIYAAPPFISSSGQEAAELAAMAGLELDPWQRYVLDQGLGERADGSWSAFEVAVNVPRQNGKGGVIEARELAGLFLLNEQLILHSAHEFKTAIEAFRRVTALVTNCDTLRKRVARVRRTTGEESIELVTGQRLRFLARSGGSGRGFSGDCNVLDEAMILGDEAMGALMPTMSARPNPQIWYLGSAGIGGPSVQLARLRERALGAMEGEPDPSLAYFEWSVEPHLAECPADCTVHDNAGDPAAWARANPAMGIRISEEHVERERLSMSSQVFARERLGAGDYPSDKANTWSVIGQDAWRALTDGESKPSDPVAFAIDMTPERSHAAICVAGTSGAAVHVEVVDHRPGVGWIVERAVDLQERWGPCAWVVDGGGPAGALIPDLERAGLTVTVPKVRDIAQACGQFYDAVTEQTLVHLDQAPLAAALAGARKRDLGEAWAWARRGVSVDISPLVAVTLAAWGLRTRVDEEEEPEPWVAYL